MAQDRPTLKGYFENGDKPNEQEFAELIDSYVHKDEDDYVQNLPEAALDGVKGIVRKANSQEIIDSSNTAVFMTPAEIKAYVLEHAPVKKVNDQVGNVNISLPELNIPDTGWQVPNLAGTGYTDVDTTLQGIRYRKVNNVVYIEGAVKGGNNNQSIFSLPDGLKPSKTLVFSSVLIVGGVFPNAPTTTTIGRIEINDGGQVIPKTVGNVMTSISGISFVVD